MSLNVEIPDRYLPHVVVALVVLAGLGGWYLVDNATGADTRGRSVDCPRGFVEVPIQVGMEWGHTCAAPASPSPAQEASAPSLPLGS